MDTVEHDYYAINRDIAIRRTVDIVEDDLLMR